MEKARGGSSASQEAASEGEHLSNQEGKSDVDDQGEAKVGAKRRRSEEQEEAVTKDEFDVMEENEEWRPRVCVKFSGLPVSASEDAVRGTVERIGRVTSVAFEWDNYSLNALVRVLVPERGDFDTISLELKSHLKWPQIEGKTVDAFVFETPMHCLYVGDINEGVGESQLRSAYERFGEIERCFIMTNDKGKSKGYGFVEIKLAEHASMVRS